jgi:quinol---cytochrome c reductase iron-sulfur subunit, bacillus type
MSSTEPGPDRRTFLAQVIGACVAFMAAVLGIPAVGAAVGPALRREEPAWYPLGATGTFKEGEPKPVNFTVARRDGWIETTDIKAVWVLRRPGDQFVVYNGRCTHLGCAYHWQGDQNQFACPCHAGVFGADGRVLAGPPPRPLDQLPTRVEGGVLEVQYYDFRLGIPDSMPV